MNLEPPTCGVDLPKTPGGEGTNPRLASILHTTQACMAAASATLPTDAGGVGAARSVSQPMWISWRRFGFLLFRPSSDANYARRQCE
jgi:hypothetical protein